MAFADPNSAALAAGAKPGDTVTIGDGQPFVVQAASAVSDLAAGAAAALGLTGFGSVGGAAAAAAGASQPPNKKMPPSAAQTKEPEHPVYLYMEADTNGKIKSVHRNPNKPSDSFESEVNHDGSFKTKEVSDGYQGMETSHTHNERKNAGSSSKNTDGNVDESNQSTKNENTKGDKGSASGGTKYEGSTKVVGGASEGKVEVVPGGKTFASKEGDSVTSLKGDQHTSITGDKVDAIVGNKMNIVKGEFGINVQGGGNFDLKVDSGKLQLSSANELTVKSTTKITLAVGNNKIVISPAGISITTKTGPIVLYSETDEVLIGSKKDTIIKSYNGDVAAFAENGSVITIAGNGTKVQNGGKIAPPTTFK
jgi:uncharacterized protein (DUF2345 family)